MRRFASDIAWCVGQLPTGNAWIAGRFVCGNLTRANRLSSLSPRMDRGAFPACSNKPSLHLTAYSQSKRVAYPRQPQPNGTHVARGHMRSQRRSRRMAVACTNLRAVHNAATSRWVPSTLFRAGGQSHRKIERHLRRRLLCCLRKRYFSHFDTESHPPNSLAVIMGGQALLDQTASQNTEPAGCKFVAKKRSPWGTIARRGILLARSA